jgi:hypothetical protein
LVEAGDQDRRMGMSHEVHYDDIRNPALIPAQERALKFAEEKPGRADARGGQGGGR